MQRLFSAFPNSCPGRGLLLQRVVTAIFLLWVRAPQGSRTVFLSVSACDRGGAGILLLLGLWTPICGTLITVVEGWIAREIPSESLEQNELREALNKALNSLPEKYRTVLILRDVQQMSIAETAKALGISEENVKTRTSRARLQMRDRLAPGWGGAWGKAHSE